MAMRGIVLWCDSDISVAKSGGIFRQAGLEVRCLPETDELLAEYAENSKDVVAIVSSMMESGGRKERGAMNALELFAKCRAVCYEQGSTPPVYTIISSSADPTTCFRAGADAVIIGKKKVMQEAVLGKLQARSHYKKMVVLWCDSNDPSGMHPELLTLGASSGLPWQPSDIALETFRGVEDMVARCEQLIAALGAPAGGDEPPCVAAVISSMMEGSGRKEKGLMNAFDGFGKIRGMAKDSKFRPVYAIVSSSRGKMDDCYARGADIAITKDNAVLLQRHRRGSQWRHVVQDVVAQLSASPPVDQVPRFEFPAFWKNAGATTGDFSEMVPIHDTSLLDALQAALRDTFKRKSDGTASSTKDRPPGERPKDFRLATAYRIEHSHLWQTYSTFRAQVGPCDDFGSCAGPGGRPKTASVRGLPDLEARVNEAYLFHGTSPEAATGIVHSGFRIDLAGTASGCAFGKGAYLAEASTKSDEYSKHGDGIFGQMYAMLLCRTVLGRTVRVEDFYHHSDVVKKLVDGIIANSTHDCLLGDRESKVGTYREFIVFKREQIYPEFVLLYHRDC